MKILFAEDDRDLSMAVKTLLERTGYLVDTVYDGAEALAYAEAESLKKDNSGRKVYSSGIMLDDNLQPIAEGSRRERKRHPVLRGIMKISGAENAKGKRTLPITDSNFPHVFIPGALK